MMPPMPDAPAAESQLRAYLRHAEPQIIAFCQRLLQTPSVNGVHPEAAVAQVIADEARRLGLVVEVVAMQPDRPNVIVSTAPTGDTGLLLLGHLDTVAVGDESRWTYPPFSGTVADGKVYGRGAIDTKGGMAAAVYALAALRETAGALNAGRAQLICVPDEESGATGTLGVKFLHAQGWLQGMGAIYAYSGEKLLLGHRGLIRYRLRCKGEMIHTGMPEWQAGTAGANAVLGMARLLVALESLPFDASPAPYFEGFRTLITPGTLVSGGVGAGMVPDYCEALADVRLTPEYTLESVTALVERCITQITASMPRLSFSIVVMNHIPAALSDERAALFPIVEGVIAELTGQTPPRLVAGPANEGYLLIERGIPCLCGLGPVGENAHAVDEYAEVESLARAANIFALTASRMDRALPRA